MDTDLIVTTAKLDAVWNMITVFLGSIKLDLDNGTNFHNDTGEDTNTADIWGPALDKTLLSVLILVSVILFVVNLCFASLETIEVNLASEAELKRRRKIVIVWITLLITSCLTLATYNISLFFIINYLFGLFLFGFGRFVCILTLLGIYVRELNTKINEVLYRAPEEPNERARLILIPNTNVAPAG